MSILFPKPNLSTSENILFSVMANRTQSAQRAVGGKLFVTNKRILFIPHRFDSLFGGKELSLNISEIDTIEKEEAGADVLGGGLRDRLKIVTSNKKNELFVVNNLDDTIKKLLNFCHTRH